MKRIVRWASLALVMGVASSSLQTAVAEEDPFASLREDNPNISVLREELKDAGPRLARSQHAAKDRNVTYCAPGSSAVRSRRATALANFVSGAAERLKGAGFKVAALPAVTVIRVPVPPGQGMVVQSSDFKFVLVRAAPETGFRAGRMPKLTKRKDGHPPIKEVVKTADKIRLAVWNIAKNAQGGASEGSVEDLLAARLLRLAGLPARTPGWAYRGLRSWIGTGVEADAADEHVCGVVVSDAIHDPSKAAPSTLARILAYYAQIEGKLPAGLEKLGAAEGTASSRFITAFGQSASDALVAADAAATARGDAAPAAAETPEGACTDGRIACPLCEGAAKLTIACPDCTGLNALVCPSCRGSDICPARWCNGGKASLGRFAKSKCAYCKARGKVRCNACASRGSKSCPACVGGKVNWSCPICPDGTIPCPQSGMSEGIRAVCGVGRPDCKWCQGDVKAACHDCGGAGYHGCDDCEGSLKIRCSDCGGFGEVLMVLRSTGSYFFQDCDTCWGSGGDKCTRCKKGKLDCETCSRKRTTTRRSADCVGCDDDGKLLDIAGIGHRINDKTRMPTEEEALRTREMIERATEFLLTCRGAGGAFALRDMRKTGASDATPSGKLGKPSLFSNSISLWALSSVGIDKNDPRVKDAFSMLRSQARALVSDKGSAPRTQEVALALRALSVGGEDMTGDLVKQLVDLLVKGQRSNGLWASELETDENGESWSGLFALESLWIAKRRGAKVKTLVFQKAVRGAKSGFTSRGIKGMKRGWISGTGVASQTALVILAKAGSLGDDASTFDYMKLREVQTGLAWLNRHFDIRKQPFFSSGARLARTSDGGYMAYLFSIQRLAMLLDIPILAGERWHTTGARHLSMLQFDDGSFEERIRGLNGPVRSTSNILMFLARATVPITKKH